MGMRVEVRVGDSNYLGRKKKQIKKNKFKKKNLLEGIIVYNCTGEATGAVGRPGL